MGFTKTFEAEYRGYDIFRCQSTAQQDSYRIFVENVQVSNVHVNSVNAATNVIDTWLAKGKSEEKLCTHFGC